MRRLRGWIPVLGWCAATLASMAVAAVALQPVLRAASPAEAAPPLDRPPAVAGPPPSLSLPPTVTASSSPARPTPSRTASTTGGTPVPTTAAPPAVTTAPPVVTADGWTVTTGTDGQRVYMRSFRVGGGQAVIRAGNGRMTLVQATPNPGYSVDTVQNEPGNLAVQFTEPNHYFVIHAVWHNDAPFAQVSEVGS